MVVQCRMVARSSSHAYIKYPIDYSNAPEHNVSGARFFSVTLHKKCTCYFQGELVSRAQRLGKDMILVGARKVAKK